MHIKRNIIFDLERRRKNGVPITENVPIRMRVDYDGGRVDFYLGFRIDEACWDKALQRVKSGCENKIHETDEDINSEIMRRFSLMQDIFKEFELEEVVPTKEFLKQVYRSKSIKATVKKS